MRSFPIKWILFIFFLAFYVWFWLCLPEPLFKNPTSYVLEDRHGNLLNASIAKDGQWRFPAIDSVPEKFIHCITTFEDKRFYTHPGVDIMSMARALISNVKSGSVKQGGSTLSMQVMRMSGQRSGRNVFQKIIESIQAVRLECNYTKAEIMNLYASNAPFGSNVVGLDAAAWRYYGRGPSKLSWGEMAALAVLPNAPSLVHPGKNREELLRKRNVLLQMLLANGTIDSATCYLSQMEPLPGKPLPLPQLAPHLLQRFKNDIDKNNLSATRAHTTVDGNLQKRVAHILQEHHQFLKGNKIENLSALVLDTETGKVLAYVGNVFDANNLEMESDVDVVKAKRSPGSTLKPILYAASLSEGLILPNSLLPDVPTQIGGYTPKNYDQSYDGAVAASMALSRSLNIPYVKMLQQYKYQRFYDLLRQLGLTTLNRPAGHYGLSLILGGSEITMWDLAGMYAGMARTLLHQNENKGLALKKDFFAPRYLIGDTAMNESKERINSLDAVSIWFAFNAMQEVMRPGEEGLWQQFNSSQKIAWKTGTSFGFRDAWAFGITKKYVVAVWAGNTTGEGRPGLIGVQAAAPVLFDIFRQLPASEWFHSPNKHFSFVPICRESGFKANIDCENIDTLMVPKNGDKSPLCPYHQMIHLDRTGQYRVNDLCQSPANMIHKKWFVLPPTMEWYFKQKSHDYKVLPPFLPGCGPVETSRSMDLVYPLPGAKIYVPLEINGERGKTIFTATHRKPGIKIFWHLDGVFEGTTLNFHRMEFSPSSGVHTLTIVDEEGNSITTKFEILDPKK